MDQELLRRNVDRIDLEYVALCNGQESEGSHFRHLAGNLLQGMKGVSHGSRFDWKTYREDFLQYWQQLRVYFGLITRFDDFRQGELSSGEGHFPEAPLRTAKEYITYAREHLH